MKTSKTLFVVIIALLFAQTVFSQKTFVGRVVEIVDGKTVTIQIDSVNKIKAELEYIEVPEPEQQLHQIVKDHLRKLVLEKDVQFSIRSLMSTRLVGKLFLGDVNISQQMLRDGAAWYAVVNKKHHDTADSESYQIIEAQAKLEKRGVWGVDGLKPAWEFRADKEKAKKELEKPAPNVAQNLPVEYSKPANYRGRQTAEERQAANANVQMWANIGGIESTKMSNPDLARPGVATGLSKEYNAKLNLGRISTKGSMIKIKSGKMAETIGSEVAYIHRGQQSDGVHAAFLIYFGRQGSGQKFYKSNSLTIFVDNKSFALGRAKDRIAHSKGPIAIEMILYQVSRETLEKIVKGKNVKFTMGSYSGVIDSEYKQQIRSLLEDSL